MGHHQRRNSFRLCGFVFCAIAALALGGRCLAADDSTVPAAEFFPKAGWQDQPNPLASPHATVGGELVVFAGQYPKSFNYYLDNNVFSAELFGAMYESMLGMHPISLEFEPALAARWSISADRKTFTFWIDEKARWSDGQPVTAEDVRWTFEALMRPENLTGVHKVALERINPPEVLGERQIRFEAKEVHWRNLSALGGMQILPKHVFGKADFNKINFEFPVVSGLYRIGEVREGMFVSLVRRDDWWNRQAPSARGVGNFATIRYRFFAESENAFEAFRKGEIDVFPVYTARIWVNETTGDRFSRNWIVKQRIHNHNPVGFQGFAMNSRRPPFDDPRVRQAIAHLVDRPKMNDQLMYNQYFLHRSYWEDLYSAAHPCPNQPVDFSPEKARNLLRESGWQVNPRTGFLEKDGRELSFRFLTRDPSTNKFLAIFNESLKDAGIRMVIDAKDWSAWAQDMDEFNYEMTWAAWGAGLFKDPEGMWASKEADRPSGNNITGFRDPRVDQLIEAQRGIFDVEKRHEICRDIDRIVFASHQYALLWNINYVRLLYWNKFGTPPTVLSKHGDERSAYWLWWYDEDAAADLKDAMATDQPLPRRPDDVHFDQVFKGR